MKCPAYACFECKDTDEQTGLVEESSATRTKVKRRGNLNDFSAIVIVQRDNVSFGYCKPPATEKPRGKYLQTDRHTF